MDNNSLARRSDRAGGLRPEPQASQPEVLIPRAKRSRGELIARPKPHTAEELAALSQWYFGKPLHLSALRVYGAEAQYEVAERYDDYHGAGWLHSEHCVRGYDYSRDFWRHVIGELFCGGIGSRSYGQTRHAPEETPRLRVLAASVASAIEARRAATPKSDAVHESADPKGDAQTELSHDH